MIPSKFNRVPKSKGKKVIKNLDGIWSVVFSLSIGSVFLGEPNLLVNNNRTEIRLLNFLLL